MSSLPSTLGQNNSYGSAGAEDRLDIWAFVETIVTHRRLIAVAFSIVFLIGLAYVIIAPPVYQADVLIQVEEKKGTTLGGLQQIATALDVAQSPVAGETDIIKSRDVIGKAIDVLHLDVEVSVKRRVPYRAAKFERKVGGRGIELAPAPFGLDSFGWGGEQLVLDTFEVPQLEYQKEYSLTATGPNEWVLLNSDGIEVAKGNVGDMVDFASGSNTAHIRVRKMFARVGNSFNVQRVSKIAAYDTVVKALKVSETAKQSSVVRVVYENNDPQDAVRIVNEIARAYLTQNVSRRSEEAEKSLGFLEQQLPELQKAVETAEVAFNNYRLSRQSVNLDKESESLLSRSVELEKQRVETELKKQDYSQRFQPNHPELVSLVDQLKSLGSEESKLAEQIKRLPETQQEFLRLERDVKVNTDLYIALLNNAQQLRIAKAGTIGNVRVIDFATPPDEPTRPNKLSVLAISGALGLFVGIFAAIVSRTLHPTMRNADFVERSGTPTYATVPESKTQAALFGRRRRKNKATASGKVAGKSNLLANLQPDDTAIEALRSMRVGLQFAMVGAENKNILITGPTPNLGKTFISANLCAVLASGGKRVLLIDTDMRRPRVSEYFGLDRAPGLSNYLAENASFKDVLHKDVFPNLDVICAGKVPPNPGELVVRPEFAALLDSVQDSYDYIFMDSPPLLPVGDSVSIAKRASAVFMVLRANQSTTTEFADAYKRLENAGVTVKGSIFNGISVGHYGYGYRYRYYAYNYYSSSKG